MTLFARVAPDQEPNENLRPLPNAGESTKVTPLSIKHPQLLELPPRTDPVRGRIIPLPSSTESLMQANRGIEAAVDAAGVALRHGKVNEAVARFATLVALAEEIVPEPRSLSWRLPAWVGLVIALAASGRWQPAAFVAREHFAALDLAELPGAFVNASALTAQWFPEPGTFKTATARARAQQPSSDALPDYATSGQDDPPSDYAHALLTGIHFRLVRAMETA
jgi:hypothetical protein